MPKCLVNQNKTQSETAPDAYFIKHDKLVSRRRLMREAASVLCLGAIGCAPWVQKSYADTADGTTLINASLMLGGNAVGIVPAGLSGLSYEKDKISQQLFNPNNTALIACFLKLGPSIIRIGGNSADYTIWDQGGAGKTGHKVSPADVDALAAFLKITGWRVIYGLNLASATAASSAAEAYYVDKVLENSLHSFEIGNEPDLYVRNKYRPVGYTPQAYMTEWNKFALAIRDAVPNAPLAGSATASGYNVASWTIAMDDIEQSKLDLLTQHRYRGAHTVNDLITPDSAVALQLRQLAGAARMNNNRLGFRMAETNSDASGGLDGVSNVYAAAFWAIDYLFLAARCGAAGLNFHSGSTAKYAPIQDWNGKVSNIQPIFYGMLLVNLAGTGELLATQLEGVDGLNVNAYAVKRADGSVAMVVSNKEQSTALNFKFPIDSGASHGNMMMLTGPSLTAKEGVTFGDSAVTIDGDWTPHQTLSNLKNVRSKTFQIAPLSVALFQVNYG